MVKMTVSNPADTEKLMDAGPMPAWLDNQAYSESAVFPNTTHPCKKFYPGIAWFVLVLVLICIPGYDLPKVDNWLIEINFDKFIPGAFCRTGTCSCVPWWRRV